MQVSVVDHHCMNSFPAPNDISNCFYDNRPYLVMSHLSRMMSQRQLPRKQFHDNTWCGDGGTWCAYEGTWPKEGLHHQFGELEYNI